MNGTSKELVGVLNNSTSISSIYQGDKLVWGKNHIQSMLVTGKFTDDSTETDWYYYYKGNVNDASKRAIEVNPQTKGFSIEIEKGFYGHLFCYTKIEHIYNFPEAKDASDFTGLFNGCENLISVDMSNVKSTEVTSIFEMFSECNKVEVIDLSGWNLTKLTTVQDAFSECRQLHTLKLGHINFSNVTRIPYMFFHCDKLLNVSGTLESIKADIDLSYCPLTNESAMIFINGLAGVSSNKTITFKASTYSTLTDEQKNLATSKGWTIAKV